MCFFSSVYQTFTFSMGCEWHYNTFTLLALSKFAITLQVFVITLQVFVKTLANVLRFGVSISKQSIFFMISSSFWSVPVPFPEKHQHDAAIPMLHSCDDFFQIKSLILFPPDITLNIMHNFFPLTREHAPRRLVITTIILHQFLCCYLQTRVHLCQFLEWCSVSIIPRFLYCIQLFVQLLMVPAGVCSLGETRLVGIFFSCWVAWIFPKAKMH